MATSFGRHFIWIIWTGWIYNIQCRTIKTSITKFSFIYAVSGRAKIESLDCLNRFLRRPDRCDRLPAVRLRSSDLLYDPLDMHRMDVSSMISYLQRFFSSFVIIVVRATTLGNLILLLPSTTVFASPLMIIKFLYASRLLVDQYPCPPVLKLVFGLFRIVLRLVAERNNGVLPECLPRLDVVDVDDHNHHFRSLMVVAVVDVDVLQDSSLEQTILLNDESVSLKPVIGGKNPVVTVVGSFVGTLVVVIGSSSVIVLTIRVVDTTRTGIIYCGCL
ncbi:hypothetical protein DERF_013179 [Dermatophagoides farinae]|uniref:Transmembrane protein n=1 Tax=Dermatophagoides farinae TaxID=6954 RepID=A0A922L229_DERFA|nr:hypothetical protein DERF_013179 [Dermatophagoides farinae]